MGLTALPVYPPRRCMRCRASIRLSPPLTQDPSRNSIRSVSEAAEMYSSTNKIGDIIEISHTSPVCELRSLGGCAGGLERHHVLSRGKLRNVPGAMKYVEANAEILLADVCAFHNVSRYADTKKARACLLKARVSIFGVEYVNEVIEGLRSLCKVPPPEWSLSALLAFPPET